jgi:hypothetical protein
MALRMSIFQTSLPTFRMHSCLPHPCHHTLLLLVKLSCFITSIKGHTFWNVFGCAP